ncbi:hypothetical protein E2562_018666 [Oryza meyeriana var. granulata]|uniref:Secreted protein n=1 Tax=Oryza meyeriana var. granulata TaxID=110450 RepID=A0A6G1BZ06_9ORYZ|nr:hypothetical protein E2562_018666 [Oryza meyeriana var. granulata]
MAAWLAEVLVTVILAATQGGGKGADMCIVLLGSKAIRLLWPRAPPCLAAAVQMKHGGGVERGGGADEEMSLAEAASNFQIRRLQPIAAMTAINLGAWSTAWMRR